MYLKVVIQTKNPEGKVIRDNLKISKENSNITYVTFFPLAQGVDLFVENEGPYLLLTPPQRVEDYNPKIEVEVTFNGERFELPSENTEGQDLEESDIIVVTSTIDGQVTTTTVVVTQFDKEDDFDEED